MSDQKTKTITIQRQAFEISQPYSEGHTCTAAEAASLNQTWGENIRNNMAKVVTAARTEAGIPDTAEGHSISLDDETIKVLQEKVTAYDNDYEFTLASVGGGRKSRDPVEIEATKIATASITAQLRDMGVTVKQVKETNPEGLKNMIADLASTKDVMTQAKKTIAARTKIAENAVDTAALQALTSVPAEATA